MFSGNNTQTFAQHFKTVIITLLNIERKNKLYLHKIVNS